MPFNYKKEYKEFYLPKRSEIPRMNYLAIRGKCGPNEENGYCIDITGTRLP